METIMMTRESGSNDWTILHHGEQGGEISIVILEVNDGSGLTRVAFADDDTPGKRDEAEERAGRAIRTIETVVQAYNGTHVGRSA